jgi:hypothetical protein
MENVEKGNASSLESPNSLDISRRYVREVLQSNTLLWHNCIEKGGVALQDLSGLTFKQRGQILGLLPGLLKDPKGASSEVRETLLNPVMAFSLRLLSGAIPGRLFLQEILRLGPTLQSLSALDEIFRGQTGFGLRDFELKCSDTEIEKILGTIFNDTENLVVLGCVLAERSWRLQGLQEEVFGSSFESARSILLSAVRDNSLSILQDIGFSEKTLGFIHRLASKVCLAPGDGFYPEDRSGYLIESLQLRVGINPALCGGSMDKIRYSLGLQLVQAASAQNKSSRRLGLQVGEKGQDLNWAMTEYLTMALFYEAGFPLFPSEEDAARAALTEMAQFCPIYFNILAKAFFGENVEEADLVRSVEIFKKFML